MGWERKRGKLHEMNLLLRGALHSSTNLSFSKVTRDMGGLDALNTFVSSSPWMPTRSCRAEQPAGWQVHWRIH